MTPPQPTEPLQAWVVMLTLVMARVSACIVTFPLFGQRYLPRLVKVGLCLTLSLAWLPDHSAAGRVVPTESWATYAVSIAGELLVGALCGYTFGLVLLPMRLAGTYVGQELGFNLGGITDPGSQSTANETGVLFESLGVLLLLWLNVHHAVLLTLHASFSTVQVNRGFAYAAWHVYARAFSQMHDAGLMLITPLATCLFVVLVVLAVLMRVWPQINLFSFGLGARLGLGLTALFVLLPNIVANLHRFMLSAKELLPPHVLGP